MRVYNDLLRRVNLPEELSITHTLLDIYMVSE